MVEQEIVKTMDLLDGMLDEMSDEELLEITAMIARRKLMKQITDEKLNTRRFFDIFDFIKDPNRTVVGIQEATFIKMIGYGWSVRRDQWFFEVNEDRNMMRLFKRSDKDTNIFSVLQIDFMENISDEATGHLIITNEFHEYGNYEGIEYADIGMLIEITEKIIPILENIVRNWGREIYLVFDNLSMKKAGIYCKLYEQFKDVRNIVIKKPNDADDRKVSDICDFIKDPTRVKLGFQELKMESSMSSRYRIELFENRRSAIFYVDDGQLESCSELMRVYVNEIGTLDMMIGYPITADMVITLGPDNFIYEFKDELKKYLNGEDVYDVLQHMELGHIMY